MGYYAHSDNNTDTVNENQPRYSSTTSPGLPREAWVEWHSVDLMNMWSSLTTYLDDACLQRDISLDMSDYHDFCKYCYERSTKTRSKNAT